MTQAAYAKHRGVARKTVTMWKSKSLLVMDGPLVCTAASDAILDGRAPIYRGGRANIRGNATVNGATPESVNLDDALGWSTIEAQRRKEIALALTRQLQYQKARDAVLPIEVIQPVWSRKILGLRNAMLSIPTKLRMRLPHLSVQDIETIRESIRETLTEAAMARGLTPTIEAADDDE